PQWFLPRVLRAEARQAMGQMEDAWADLVGPAEHAPPDLQALLDASALWIALAERERKSGLEGADQIRRAREFSTKALAISPEHPVALTLHSESSLLLVQASIGQGRSESEHLEEIIRAQERALARSPDYIKARMILASAFFIRGESARGI